MKQKSQFISVAAQRGLNAYLIFNSPKTQSLFTFGVTWLCFAGFLQYWLWERAHICSVISFGSLLLLSMGVLSCGARLLPLLPLPKELALQRSLQLFFGFLIFNTALFFLVVLKVCTVKNGFFFLVVISFLGALTSVFKKNSEVLTFREQIPGIICLLLSGIGATLLCCDSLSVPINENGMIYLPFWQDSFVHTRLIGLFAEADAVHSIPNIFVAAEPQSHFHHDAPYILSAAVASLTHVSSWIIFGCFLLPVGVFLLGLAAFVLAQNFWKGWPAVAATVAVLFLPDAYYQGFQNKFLSYHFHLHVGPASFYGIASVALAWMLMLQGCRLHRLSLVFWGYVFLGLTLFYKPQFFVANAFIIWIFPCFFFLRCEKRKRVLVAFGMALFFSIIVLLSQHSPSIPVIALNGGGIHKYCKILSLWTDNGFIHSFLIDKLWNHPLPSPLYHLLAGTMLYFCTFGFWGIIVLIVAFFVRQKVDSITKAFPWWIIISYLVMSLGLALNSRPMGRPEELVNRPLMWAYFAVVTWSVSGLYFLFFKTQLPKTWLGRGILFLIVSVSLVMPLSFAHGLQTMPMWNITLKSNPMPMAMMEAIDYIKRNSQPFDLIQDSENDPICAVTALTERQEYNIDDAKVGAGNDPLIRKRVKDLEAFKEMQAESDLKTFLQAHRIVWYLLRPETKVAWPDSFKNSAVFESGGYRVYQLQPSKE